MDASSRDGAACIVVLFDVCVGRSRSRSRAFTVEVNGVHNYPTEEGGYRNTKKRRVFHGKADLKHAGDGPQDVWVSERCSGSLEVADEGRYKRRDQFGGWGEVPTAVTGKHQVEVNAPGADGCSFTLMYDRARGSANIVLDQPGPRRIEVVERTNISTIKTHINPFDWSAVRKFESGMIKVAGTRTGHSGEWFVKGGEPIAMAGEKRVKGDVVETSTRVSWQFTGEPLPPRSKGKKSYDEDDDKYDSMPLPPFDAEQEAAFACLLEQQRSGRQMPDPDEFDRCMEEKEKEKAKR